MRLFLIKILLLFNIVFCFSQAKYVLNTNLKLLECSEDVLTILANMEINERDNPDIVFEIIKSVGYNNRNAQWCAALQYFAFYCCDSIFIPLPKTLVANNMYNFAKINGIKAIYKAEQYDLLVWKKVNSWQGHIERIYKVLDKKNVITIGGNTSKDNSNERNGGGVYYKKRNILAPISRLLLVRGLIGFNY